MKKIVLLLALLLLLPCVLCACGDRPAQLEFAILEDGVCALTGIKNKERVREIVVPATYNGVPVTEICAGALQGLRELERVTLPEGIVKIGEHAFRDCTALMQLNIPSTVTSVGVDAFAYCPGLVDENAPVQYYGGWLFHVSDSVTDLVVADGTVGIADLVAFSNTELKTVTFADSVRYIGLQSFDSCENLNQVTFGKELERIAWNAFSHCEKVKKVTLSPELKWYDVDLENDYATPVLPGTEVYVGNELLTELVIPEGTRVIRKHTYSCMRSIEKVTIPKSLKTLEASAFYGTDIKSVHISDLDAWCELDIEGDAATPVRLNTVLYLNGEPVYQVEIKEGATRIKPYVFANYRVLTNVTIPDSVTEIGAGAFAGCQSLGTVVFGENTQLRYIGVEAFTGCYSMESILIPKSVEIIDEFAFWYCSGAKYVEIGENVTYIGRFAFAMMEKVEKVHFVDPNGWFVTPDPSAASGTPINVTEEGYYLILSEELHHYSNPYRDYYWKKS